MIISKKYPLVTICLPVYNNDRHLKYAIESILNQTYENIEVIAIDDCSVDDSLKILSDYESKSFRIYRNTHNIGMASNWNKCIKLSNGNFIKMMGGDDFLLPNCIEEQVNVFAKVTEPLSIVTSSKGIIRDTGALLFEIQNSYSGYVSSIETIRRLVRSGRNNIGEPVVCLLKKQAIVDVGYFFGKNDYTLDISTWIRMLRLGGLYGLESRHADFRISITSNGANEGIRQLSQYYSFIKDLNIEELSRWDILVSIVNSFFAGLARNAVFAYVKATTK